MDAADGYNMDVNIKKVLSGMGFAQDTWQKNIAVLSGGELTRLRLAKLLLEKPDVLILDEPTRGIDVGAKYEIYCIIADLAKQGKSIIMISSEMSEIIGMSNRVMVMCDGRITGFINGKDATQENIMALATQFETAPDAAAANQ